MKILLIVLSLTSVLAMGGARADDAALERNPDPWVKANRRLHGFNDAIDRTLLRPVAVAYDKVVPQFAKIGVRHFFGNLEDVGDVVNNVLQGKFRAGASDVLRITLNTTIGLGGLLDPASDVGLVDHDEDFGQTLAVWGVPAGPFIVIPGRGPSTIRDGLSLFVSSALYPLYYYEPVAHRNSLIALDLLHDRAALLDAESVVFGDKYIFYREAYLQRREFLINDGEVEDSFGDDF